VKVRFKYSIATRENVTVFIICAVSSAILIGLEGMGRIDLWKPLSFHGDSETAYFAGANAARYGSAHFNPNAGAPFPSELYLFPQRDPIGTLIQWIIGRFDANAFFVTNVFTIVCFYLAALAFYASLRFIGVRPLFAASLSICFAFVPYTSEIISQSVTFPLVSVPMGLAVALGATWADENKRSNIVAILVFSVLIGLGSPYWAFFVCVLIGFSGALSAFAKRSATIITTAMASIATIIISFVAGWLPVILPRLTSGYLSQANAKPASHQALLGLNYLDLIAPLHSPLVLFRALADRYWLFRSPYTRDIDISIGIAGIAGLSVLTVILAQWFGRGMAPDQSRLEYSRRVLAGLLVWSLLFCVTNGVGFAFGVFVTPMFRAQVRMGVVIAAICMFALAITFEIWSRRTKARYLGMVMVSLCALSLWEQTANISWPREQARATTQNREYYAHASICSQAEQILPHGAQVLQMPILPYVDGGTVLHSFHPYYHLACPLMTTSLKWSFGIMGGSAADEFVSDMNESPMPEQIARAAAAGFRAILLDKRAYEDDGRAIIAELKSLIGPVALVTENDTLALFDMRPLLDRLPDLGDGGFAPVVVDWRMRGFSFMEKVGSDRWIWNDAPTSRAGALVCNYRPTEAKVRVSGSILAARPVRVRAFIKSQTLNWNGETEHLNPARFDESVLLPPGCHVVEFGVDSDPLPPSPRSVGFRLINPGFCDVDYYARVETVLNSLSPQAHSTHPCLNRQHLL
jgi:hypothetical protein